MNKYLFFFLLGLISVPLLGAKTLTAVKPENFAFGLSLDVAGEDAFYEIEVPLSVYQGVTKKNLADMRFFNSEKHVVPHFLSKSVTKRIKIEKSGNALPFFPIIANAKQKIDDLSIQVERNTKGSIVDVKVTDPPSQTLDKKIISYLIDASKLEQAIDTIELFWPRDSDDFLGKVVVETSNDLEIWRHMQTSSIARLTYLGHSLDRSKISLSFRKAKYLRLTWPKEQSMVGLTKIVAIRHGSYETAKQNRQWIEVESKPLPGSSNKYFIELNGIMPVDQIKIRLQNRNSLASMKLYSGDSKEEQTEVQWNGLVYNLVISGQHFSTPEINIRHSQHRYWTVEIQDNETHIGSAPILEFGWQPDRAIFLAQGKRPFFLAYGSAEVKATSYKINNLLNTVLSHS